LKPVAVWARPFDDPILLPGGRELVTLRDAADYITSLPKAEQNLDEWQAARTNGARRTIPMASRLNRR
jgi:hypothetical protein